jgi:hypothetical protein
METSVLLLAVHDLKYSNVTEYLFYVAFKCKL